MRIPDCDQKTLRNLLLLSLILFFCLYLRTLSHQLFADDYTYLVASNPFLREAPWSEIYKLFQELANRWEFLPLRDFTYWLDFRLYGDDFVGFHVTHLLWYALSATATYTLFYGFVLFCRPDWKNRVTLLSLCGTLLFVAHPAHVEVVAWLASRKDLVAGTFGLFSLVFLLRALQHDWNLREISVSALLLFAACFGKSTAVSFLVMIDILLYVNWRTESKVETARKICILLLFQVLIASVLAIHLNVGVDTGVHIENYPGVFAILERASRILTALIGILLFPYPMHFLYDVYRLGDWHWLVSFCALLSVTVALYVLSKKRTLWAFGVILTFSPLVVYLQFAPFSTWSLASERFVFVSVAGLSLLLIDFLGRIKSAGAMACFLFPVIFSCFMITCLRLNDWGGGKYVLHEFEYEYQPNFHSAALNLIFSELIPERRYDEAIILAQVMRRAYLVEPMLLMIEAEQAYLPFRKFPGRKLSDSEKEVSREKFCALSDKLGASIQQGNEHIKTETDISYEYIINTLLGEHKYRFGNKEKLCAKE